jgi:hypothetical protein
MRSERVDALRASIYPLTATFTPQPPLTRPLDATNPLTSPSRALDALAKMTSVTEITARHLRSITAKDSSLLGRSTARCLGGNHMTVNEALSLLT